MKCLVTKREGISFVDVDLPVPMPGEIGIRVACSLISPGTELRYANEAAAGAGPVALGYCVAGEVETVGDGTEAFRIGDRVVALGWGWALHAPHVVVPWRLCAKVPDNMNFEVAVFAALGATAQHTLARAHIRAGETVLVLGLGVVGQLVCIAATTEGARLLVVDPSRFRVELATQVSGALGLPATPSAWMEEIHRLTSGADVVVITAHGEKHQLPVQAITALRQQPNGRPIGRIVIVGKLESRLTFGVELGDVDIRCVSHCGYGYRDDEYVHGRVSYPVPQGLRSVDENLVRALACLQTIDIARLHTHRFPFADAREAYNLLVHSDEAVGVTLHYDHSPRSAAGN